MKTITAAAAAISIALAAAPALAGVVITQQQTINAQSGQQKRDQTVMVQGNKQKMITGDHEIITDLDKGVMYVIEPARKDYLEIPFPPRGPMAAAMARKSTLNFKKSGESRKVAGYSCEDYKGTGESMAGDYTVTECVSTSAPGAKEFNAFEKLMASKLKGTGMAPSGDVPAGVPLASDSVVKLNKLNLPGMSPEQQQKLQAMLAKRKPTTTSTVVTKIEEKQLAEDTFTVPAGFTKREFHAPMGMAMPHGAASPAAKK
jgi:Domain of unknown function (DUF4412)